MTELITYWVLMAITCFVQNMAFTAVSRSRNAGNPKYHRKCALCSNSIYFLCNLFIMKQVMPILMAPEMTSMGIAKLVGTLAIYAFATSEGSVLMMKICLRKETGDKCVGAKAKA